ncbi:ribosome silencing factor [Anaerolineales bacterium HSG24]|nr:ribosome silencing factor [Anaerolineales bacterium HSG24]
MEVILNANDLAHAVLEIVESKKAANILMLDMSELTLLADYYVLCDATSNRQINAIKDELLKQLKKAGTHFVRVEGTPDSGWMLVDFGSVIAHIFSPEQRAYYQLESLWQDAPVVVRML